MQRRSFSLILAASFLIFNVKVSEANPSKGLSLEEATQILLQQNPELKAMKKESEAAQAKVPQAKGWDDPQVGVRFYQVPFGEGLGKAMDIDYIASQKIPFPGKKKAAGQIAYHEYLHHLESLNARGRQLVREMKTVYYKLFVLDRQLAQSFKLQKLLLGWIQSAQANLSSGQGMASEVVQAQTELAKQGIERESLQAQRAILETQLRQILASSEIATIQLPNKLDLPQWNRPLEKLEAMAQSRHSDLKLAQHQIGQKNWAIKAAKREYLPDLSTQLEYVQRPGGQQDAWTGEFMVNLPLQVAKKKGAVTQAKAELSSAEYAYESAKNKVSAQVKQAYLKTKTAEKVFKLYDKSLIPQAQQAVEMSSVAYSTQQAPLSNLLNAEQALLNAQKDYWQAYEDFLVSLAELEEAIGISWENMDEALTQPDINPQGSRVEGK